MFLDGLIKLYVHDPAMFWVFITCIAPAFVVSVLYGLYVQSQEFNGRHMSEKALWLFILGVDFASLAWTTYVFDSPLSRESLGIGLAVTVGYFVLLLFPIIGGLMTGLWLMRAYWFVRRAIHWLKNFKIE